MIAGDKWPDVSEWPELPSHVEAECAILGYQLLDNSVYADHLKGRIEADEFSLSSHRLLYSRMVEMLEAGKPVDTMTLSNYLAGKTRADGKEIVWREIDDIGGVAYLAGLTEGRGGKQLADYFLPEYVAILKEKAKLRRIWSVCEQAIRQCKEQSVPAVDIVKEMGVGLKGIKR